MLTAIELRKSAAEKLKEADAIYAKAEEDKTELTDEQRSEVDSLIDESKSLVKDAERREVLDAQREWMAGPMGDDPPHEPIREKKPEEFKSFGEQLRAVARAETPGRPTIDNRLIEERAPSGMNVGLDSQGGFLVGEAFSKEIFKRVYEGSPLANGCRKVTLGAGFGRFTMPTIDESSRVDGSRWGGVRAYWTEEAGTVTASKPAFGKLELVPKKLMAIYYATEESLADTASLGQVATMAFAEEISFQVEDALFRGNGTGKPLGITTCDAYIAVAKEGGQTAATIVYKNVQNMWARMYAKSRANAAWYINQDTEVQLGSMNLPVGTGGVPVYLPAGGASVSGYSSLYGRPVIPIEHADTLGSSGDIVLADMSQVLLVDCGSPTGAQSAHVRFLYDEQTFRLTYRIDGQSMWSAALTPYKGSNTQSPFIGLAERA